MKKYSLNQIDLSFVEVVVFYDKTFGVQKYAYTYICSTIKYKYRDKIKNIMINFALYVNVH